MRKSAMSLLKLMSRIQSSKYIRTVNIPWKVVNAELFGWQQNLARLFMTESGSFSIFKKWKKSSRTLMTSKSPFFYWKNLKLLTLLDFILIFLCQHWWITTKTVTNITNICGSITGVIRFFHSFLGETKGVKN